MSLIFQGILVTNLTPFLTLSVRNGPNLKKKNFNISLNPRRVEQNYTIYL